MPKKTRASPTRSDGAGDAAIDQVELADAPKAGKVEIALQPDQLDGEDGEQR